MTNGKSVGAMLSRALTPAMAALFAISGCAKLLAGDGFIRQVESYRLLPETLAIVAGHAVPFLEIVGACALATRKSRRRGAACLLVLASLFTVAAASAMTRGLDIACGCFGSLGGKIGYGTLLLDLVVMVALVRILHGGSINVELDRTGAQE